jgi:MFS family permease
MVSGALEEEDATGTYRGGLIPGGRVAEITSSPGVLEATKAAVRETGTSLASVFRNRNLRRINLALAGSMIGDWAYATAVTVWAYGVGGATAVGIWGAIRLTLMAFTAPMASTLADRLPRRQVMIGADLFRASVIAGAAATMFLHGPVAVIFVLATITSLAGTPFRAAQSALMPSLANRPEELTAANGTASTLESLSFFVGPALGAFLIAVADVPIVFLVNAATFLWSSFMVMGIRVPAKAPARAPADTAAAAAAAASASDLARIAPDPVPVTAGSGLPAAAAVAADVQDSDDGEESFLTQTLAGFRSIFADRDLLVVVGLVAAQTVIAGASVVYTVLIAVDILKVGAHGVGYLDSVLGVGAIIGGFVAISRSSRRRLGQDMAYGVVLWSLPLLLITAWPSPVAAFAAMVVLGFANPLVDVNMATIVQRITPDAVMGRVFGALEACLIGTMALGSALMPFLVHWIGLRGALAAIGIVITLCVLPCLPRMRRLDQTLSAPAGLPFLRAIPMFAPLSPPVLETLARGLGTLTVPAGQVILSEGGDSDQFFVLESGLVEVTQGGRVLRREGPGDFFGEIGLLRDVPRTATITAVEDSTILTMDRDAFLSAVTGDRESSVAADDIVSRRLTV